MPEAINLIITQPFLQRALVAGVLLSLCAALLGVSLVLKRFSMIGDGLSHVGFGALAIACAANVAPLYFSLPVVIIAAFLLLRMSESGKNQGRRRHCPDFNRCACGRSDGNLADNRNEY